MNIKAVFFDIDGTLMDTKRGIVPESAINAIQALKKQDIKVFVATSRTDGEFGNFQKYIDEIGFDGIISCGGALLRYNDQIINKEIMKHNDVMKIVEYCSKNKLGLRYQSDINCHLDEEPSKEVYDSFIYFYNFCPSTKKYENENVINLLGFGNKENYDDIMNMCEDIEGILYSDAFELLKKGVSKASGIKKMCELLGIDISSSLAFGDAENDIEMLKTAGIGVAMGNACESCQEAADYVTKRYDEDGIAYALEHFGLVNSLHLTKDNQALRQADNNDVEALLSWWNDGKVMSHAGFPNGLNKNEQDILNELSTNNKEQRRLIMLYDDFRIGEMSYKHIGNDVYDFGIKICNEEYQNRHLGPKYLALLFDYLFDELNAKTIILDTDLENTRAQKVYERIGFTNKVIKYNSWVNAVGETRSSVSYSMNKEQYRKD